VFFYLFRGTNSLNPFSLCSLVDRLILRAGVAELADALDSKSSDRKVVEVQVLSPVLFFWFLAGAADAIFAKYELIDSSQTGKNGGAASR
jgi:hypothetical protein